MSSTNNTNASAAAASATNTVQASASLLPRKPDVSGSTKVVKTFTKLKPKAVAKSLPPKFPFDKLPLQVRNKIFEMSLPGFRIVKIQSYEERKPDRTQTDCRRFAIVRVKAVTDVPVHLRLCKTSRAVGLRHYKLSFAEGLNGRPVYFDFEVDALFSRGSYTIPLLYGNMHLHHWDDNPPHELLSAADNFAVNPEFIEKYNCRCPRVDRAPTIKSIEEGLDHVIFESLPTPQAWKMVYKMDNLALLTASNNLKLDTPRLVTFTEGFEEWRGYLADGPDIEILTAKDIAGLVGEKVNPKKKKTLVPGQCPHWWLW